MQKFLSLAIRNVFRNKRRTLMTLLVVSGGVAGLLLTGSFFAFMFRGLREQTIRNGLGHLQINNANTFRRDETHALENGLEDYACDAAMACSRSQIMSSTSSIPTEIRTRSFVTPASICCSSFNCWCVVEDGWMMRLLASPRLARCEKSCTESISLRPASSPPLMPKVTIEPQPCGRYFRARPRYGLDSRPGYFTQDTVGCFSSHSATCCALRLCCSMRNFRVSIPCRNRNELNGLMHGPKSRRPSTRALMMKASPPKTSVNFMPWWPGLGSVSAGNFALHGNFPLSTMMPPIDVPWPPRNLVAEWTTISAPCSMGRQR